MKFLNIIMIAALALSTSACSGKAVAVGLATGIGAIAGAQINEDFDIAPVQKEESAE
jgi:hypothetical protein